MSLHTLNSHFLYLPISSLTLVAALFTVVISFVRRSFKSRFFIFVVSLLFRYSVLLSLLLLSGL